MIFTFLLDVKFKEVGDHNAKRIMKFGQIVLKL